MTVKLEHGDSSTNDSTVSAAPIKELPPILAAELAKGQNEVMSLRLIKTDPFDKTMPLVNNNVKKQIIEENVQHTVVITTASSTTGTTPSGKRKMKGKDEKVCSVCGDKALGCNFDAISCESCKAFFRRNALRDKVSVYLNLLYITMLEYIFSR